MLVVDKRDENEEGTKGFNFRPDQNVTNVNYTGEVTLIAGFSNDVVHCSFGIADCSKMRVGGSGRYDKLRPIFTIAPLGCGCTSKSEKMKLTK